MRNKDKYNLLLLLLMSVHNFIWFYCYTDFFFVALWVVHSIVAARKQTAWKLLIIDFAELSPTYE